MSAENPPFQVVAKFEVKFSRYLDADGQVVAGPLPEWAREADTLLPIYRVMVQTRVFDAKALHLQRTGQLGTYASPLGQEAVGAAVASAMEPHDVLLPSYREFSAQLLRGVTMTELLQYWGGDERGSDFTNAREDFPICVPIASHTLHAVGVAYAFKLRCEPRVAVCFVGDGATSKGDFYEALNVAGVWAVPMLMIVSNNEWAISVPRDKQSVARTLAQKAIAAGVPGEQVDGNDAIAVRAAALRGIQAARAGEGPYLIEALTYRLGDHTTADDASRYRDPSVVEQRKKADPIARLQNYLLRAGLLSEADQQAIAQDCARRAEQAASEYRAIPAQPTEAMFDYLYASLPTSLLAQRKQALAAADG